MTTLWITFVVIIIMWSIIGADLSRVELEDNYSWKQKTFLYFLSGPLIWLSLIVIPVFERLDKLAVIVKAWSKLLFNIIMEKLK